MKPSSFSWLICCCFVLNFYAICPFNSIFTTRKRSLGQGNILVACVKNSVHRGGLPQCMLGYHPPGADPPGIRHPLGADPPWSSHPLGVDTPSPHSGSRHPPLHSACWEIRSTSGRYASYWNAILCFNAIRNWFRAMNAVFQHKII